MPVLRRLFSPGRELVWIKTTRAVSMSQEQVKLEFRKLVTEMRGEVTGGAHSHLGLIVRPVPELQ